MRWERVNTVGYGIEMFLRIACLTVSIALALLLVMRLEWRMLPTDAKEAVLCEEEMETLALLPQGAANAHPEVSQRAPDCTPLHDAASSTEYELPPLPIAAFDGLDGP